MTYIVLQDTFGEGLETVATIGLDVIEGTEQLNDAILAAIDEIEDRDYGKKLSIEGVVVCKLLDEIEGVDLIEYVKNLYDKDKHREKEERYKMYQELKEEFGP